MNAVPPFFMTAYGHTAYLLDPITGIIRKCLLKNAYSRFPFSIPVQKLPSADPSWGLPLSLWATFSDKGICILFFLITVVIFCSLV
jgi:hypothetical protein